MTRSWIVAALVLIFSLPALARAQDASSGTIAGVVRDQAGAVLPGVTVEASSPALIERTRSTVSDGEGRYRLVDLRSGAYTVTFSLQGFKTVRREGIELTTGFVATVNADLGVGAIAETITVTGEAPVVDVQGMTQQQVFSRDTVKALPIGKNAGIYAALIPGAAPLNPTQQDVGGTKGEDTQWFRMHDSGRSTQLRDGMFVGTPMGGANFNSAVNPATIEEVAVAFHVSPLVVQRRLRLANVHSDFLELFRKGTIKITHMMALGVTDDIERQKAAWLAIPESHRTPEVLRQVLTETEIASSSPVAKFVGLDVYRAAGGPVSSDLFSDEKDAVFLGDFFERCGPDLNRFRSIAIRTQTKGVVAADVHQRGKAVKSASYSFVIH